MTRLKMLTPARLLGFAAALTFTGASFAAPINYGDFSDIPPGSVMYTDVTETANTPGDTEPLYGAPTISGNELDFDPAGFSAAATGGASDITDGQLNFGFMTEPGTGLTGLVVSESGDFSLFGAGTSVTSVGAGLFADVEITHVNGVALATPITVIASTQFSTDLASSPGLTQPWGNVLFIDFAPALLNAGFDPQTDLATKGEIVIDNTLVAISENNPSTAALITKKDFKLIPQVIVPEPGSIALLGIGGLLLARRRRA